MPAAFRTPISRRFRRCCRCSRLRSRLTIGALGHGLLETYLGADPARRVLAGSVRRGEVSSVEAVLLYADLRSFTPFADTLPGNELMALLDSCFACMVRPVSRHGGEVLKFLGDGLLAIFRIDERRRRKSAPRRWRPRARRST